MGRAGCGKYLVLGALLGFFSSPATAQDRVLARASAESPTIVQNGSRKPVPQPAKTIARTGPQLPSAARRKPLAKAAAKPAPQPRYPTYGEPAKNDDPERDDPVVRAAAVKALGKLMGAVVVVDPANGRVLSVVNQPLAFGGGYQPCSAFKPVVALAALNEGIIENDRTRLQLGKRWFLDLNTALAISNNLYFEKLGRTLGIAKLEQYARQFGFGEPAGWEIDPEPAGRFPNTPPPAKVGGVGRVASFGQGISMTMFQLASFVSALANGGTLYYLQYPHRYSEEITPHVKRELSLGATLNVVQAGMEEAVLTGTARRAKQSDLRLVGKTGTCSENGARLGWFAGYNREPGGVAIVVLLRTGQMVGGGPRASEVAGEIFRQLGEEQFYARSARRSPAPTLPASIHLPAFQ